MARYCEWRVTRSAFTLWVKLIKPITVKICQNVIKMTLMTEILPVGAVSQGCRDHLKKAGLTSLAILTNCKVLSKNTIMETGQKFKTAE